MSYEQRRRVEPEENLAHYLEAAKRIAAEFDERAGRASQDELDLSADFEHLRWFPLPHEAEEHEVSSRRPSFSESP